MRNANEHEMRNMRNSSAEPALSKVEGLAEVRMNTKCETMRKACATLFYRRIVLDFYFEMQSLIARNILV
jgi:hypothetical protein